MIFSMYNVMYICNFKIIIILLIYIYYTSYKYIFECFVSEKYLFSKYLSNSYVNSLPNCKKSKKRLNLLYSEFERNNLPIPKLNSALHYERDKILIQEKYPSININSEPYKRRKGAYGLTASFINFLEINSNNDYAVWYEDDAIPSKNIKFINEFIKSLKTLPKTKNAIYFFAYTTLCKKKCNLEKIGWNRKKHKYGTHAILFTKNSINILLKYFKSHIINLPIDNLIYYLNSKGYVTAWEWNGSRAGKDDMICGLFDQNETMCNHNNDNNII